MGRQRAKTPMVGLVLAPLHSGYVEYGHLWPLVQTMQFQKVKQCIVGYSFSLETRQNESLKPLIPGEYLIVLRRLHYHCKRHLLKKNPKQTKLNKLYNTVLSNKLPQMLM